MRLKWHLPVSLLLTGLLSACLYQSTSPGRSEIPIYKPPQAQTLTPAPTPTVPADAYIQTGNPLQVTSGMYSFVPVTNWDESGVPLAVHTKGSMVTLSNAEETLFFSLNSEPASPGSTTQACLDKIVQNMAADISDLQVSASTPLTTQSGKGLRTNLQARIFSQITIGSLLVIQVNQRCFSLFGLATSDDSATLWERSGAPVLDRLMQSVHFLEASQLMYCEISKDSTYGFSPENPIRTGNSNLYDGRTRQENYLLTLRGPNNEEIYFTRQTPQFNAQGAIVDPYRIEYAQIPQAVTLYFDMNVYEPLFAPQGFSCEAAFPISEP